MPIIPTESERIIQGGVPCTICGATSPCGNILDCGWWTSEYEENLKRERESEEEFEHEREAYEYKLYQSYLYGLFKDDNNYVELNEI